MIESNVKTWLSKSYNNKAEERDSYNAQNWKMKEREVFLSYIKKENKLKFLEVGAGPGRDSLYFKEQGLQTLSTDLSEEMVRLCKKKELDAAVMSFDNLNISDDTYDAVWALNCLLHVPKKNIKDVLIEIKRVMKRGGLFYIGVYGGKNHEGIWEDDAYEPKRFFSFHEDVAMKQLVSSLFEIEYFHVIPPHEIGGELSFQSIIVRKND